MATSKKPFPLSFGFTNWNVYSLILVLKKCECFNHQVLFLKLASSRLRELKSDRTEKLINFTSYLSMFFNGKFVGEYPFINILLTYYLGFSFFELNLLIYLYQNKLLLFNKYTIKTSYFVYSKQTNKYCLKMETIYYL